MPLGDALRNPEPQLVRISSGSRRRLSRNLPEGNSHGKKPI